ncbi:acyl-CoA N-acyltransferase [Dissophora ornata]|nr:hypothetical protein BGZ58_002314 [Dissophora ornata]KAI8598547.1 acyl-CoA N-acyltransferase [Dissophora ornata]
MTTTTTKTPFKLFPATPADFDAMGEISGDAFLTDSHTLLKAVWKGDNFHREGSREGLVDLFNHPRVDITVARKGVDGTGEVIGSIIWARRGYEEDADTTATAAAVATTTITSTMTFPPPPAPVQAPSPSSPLTIKELEESTNNAMTHYVDHLMPQGTKCRYVYGLTVAPGYQGQGIGSALLKWGTDKADQEGVFCFVSSSMDGWRAYAKAGFVEVGRQELRLDDYAQGIQRKVKGEDGVEREEEWGMYIWRWMIRDPKVV